METSQFNERLSTKKTALGKTSKISSTSVETNRLLPTITKKAAKCAQIAGFSLIEVTLAMGITSFALVTMFSTMAVGMGVMKDATDDTMHAQIASQIASTVLQTPFDQLAGATDGKEFYFDRQGKEVPVGDCIYKAKLNYTAGGVDTYPGAPTNLAPSMSSVRIQVTTRTSAGGASTFSSLIIPRS